MIIDIEKQPTWVGKIIELEVGDHFYAPYSKRHTIAPIISRLKKEIEHHKKQYETKLEEIDNRQVLKVKRLEDKKNEFESND